MRAKLLRASAQSVLIAMCLSLLGCGGGGGDPGARTGTLDDAPPVVSAPGGLYVGYFQEDPAGNPEDPEAGAFAVKIPEADGALSGSMYFTYVDCQSRNAGSVAGSKTGNALAGTWSAIIDNSAQSGTFSGAYSSAGGAYAGVYVNADGKQFKNVAGCLQHSLAANGSWAVFPVEQNQPSSFALSVAGTAVSWTATAGSSSALVYVIDSTAALAGSSNSVVFQNLFSGTGSSFSLATVGLVKGKEYIVAVMLSDGGAVRKAFGSKRFIAP
ncbi:MAG: hypothetical protein Q7T62_05945 [Undibacterium sp.]|nr:hypothetical protein [Undibacterium sp.]